MALMRIAGKFEMSKKISKAKSAAGRVLGDENSTPDERSAAGSALASESISPMKTLLAHVREFVEEVKVNRGLEAGKWLDVFESDLARIEGK
jgi:hypothetical protein